MTDDSKHYQELLNKALDKIQDLAWLVREINKCEAGSYLPSRLIAAIEDFEAGRPIKRIPAKCSSQSK